MGALEDTGHVLGTIVTVLSLIGLGAGAVGAILYMRTKGAMDALQKTVTTYKELAEALEAKVLTLEEERTINREELHKMRVAIEEGEKATRGVLAALVDAIIASGLCLRARTCPDRIVPTDYAGNGEGL